jgi:signal transduction histidine kinase/DNA-binding response OmpR family regulator/ligand-binding sensor domain-containing protein
LGLKTEKFYFILIWIAILCFAIPSISFAQSEHFHVNHYTKNDGLSHREVLTVHRDSLGFIWLGTSYGLNRFDGHDFMWFTREKDGLASNLIAKIQVDTDGLMWLMELEGTFHDRLKHITLFNPYENSVIDLQDRFPEGLPFALSDVLAVKGQPGEILFFYTRSGTLFSYDKQFTELNLDLGTYEAIADIIWREDEKLIFLLENGFNTWSIGVYDLKSQSYEVEELQNANFVKYVQGSSDADFSFLTTKRSGTDGGLALTMFAVNVMGDLEEIRKHPLLNMEVQPLLGSKYGKIPRSDGHYWMAFRDYSFYLVDVENGQKIEELSASSMDRGFIMDVYIDEEGIAWVATQFGLYSFHEKVFKFKTLLTEKAKGEGDLFSVRGITQDNKGYLWVKSEIPRSLWRIDPESGEELKFSALNRSEDAQIFDRHIGYVSAKLKSGKIFSYNGPEIGIIDPVDLSLDKIISTNPKGRSIWTIYEHEDGKIWYFDQLNNEVVWLEDDQETLIDNKLDPIYHVFVYHIERAIEKDKVWLGTDRGIYLFDLRAQKVAKHYYPGGQGAESFEFEVIYHMYRDLDNTLWLATSDAGLVQVQHTSSGLEVLKHLTIADGLADNIIYAIYGDQNHNLWVATNNGISKYDKVAGTFTGFSVSDGLSDSEFNRVSHFQDDSGKIYFGGLNGITLFDPGDFTDNPANPGKPIQLSSITQVSSSNSTRQDILAEVRKGKVIEINPGDRYLSMSFALMNYSKADENHYAYRIDGVEEDWIYLEDNQLQISHLPYGKHKLRVKGQNATGTWSDKTLSLNLKVNKPVYLKTWFLILALISLIAILSILYRIRVRALKNRQFKLEKAVETRTQLIQIQNDKLKELDAIKSKFFTNVSHELRTPLTLILGPINSLLKNKKGNHADNQQLLTLAKNSANQLLKLVNAILDLSKLESGKMQIHEGPVALYPFVKQVYAQFESNADLKRLKYNFHYGLDEELIIELDREKLETVVNNLLSNAFKFTDTGGAIDLGVQKQSDQLVISVKDTGKGIHPDHLPKLFERYYQEPTPGDVAAGGTGIGLALCYEMAKALGGSISVNSMLNKGSEFILTLPFKEAMTPASAEAVPKHEAMQNSVTQKEQEEIAMDPNHIGQQKARILVVEDNPALLAYIDLILRPHYKVETAANGQQALELLKSKEVNTGEKDGNKTHHPFFDLIISDIMMPVMDGYVFIRELKKDKIWRNIPVLMLTAVADREGKLKALKIGVDDYLVKPFDEDEMLLRIQTMITNYQQRKRFWAEEEIKQNGDRNKPVSKEEASHGNDLLDDDNWLEFLQKTVWDQMDALEFNAQVLSEKMHLSTRQLRRRVKQETGLTPHQYILESRLQKARYLLENGGVRSVKSLASKVGLKDEKNFSKRYKERFGRSPSSYFD